MHARHDVTSDVTSMHTVGQVIVTNPMERVKVLQQLMGKSGGTVASIVQKIGISGLYQVRF